MNLLKKYKEIILYLIFGVLTTLVSLTTYFILTSTILNADNSIELQIANIVAWIVSVLFAFFTNRKYVFESSNNDKIREFAKFTFARLATLVLDMLIMGVGVTYLKFNDIIVKIISQFVVIVSNYVYSKLFVFKK